MYQLKIPKTGRKSMRKAWVEDGQTICTELKSDSESGLTEREVKRRQAYGKNDLGQTKRLSAGKLFFLQFTDTMVLVLLAAAVLSGLIGDVSDAVVILSIVFFNAVLGFVQEFQAERSLEEMQKMTAPRAWVIRGGKKQEVPASELVVGDIVLLQAGDQTPADLRLLACEGVLADESALTGESNSVEKTADALENEAVPLAERRNMVWMGTVIPRGQAKGIVTAIGMDTELGQVAQMIHQTDSGMTPLQRRLAHLGKWLILFCLLVCLLVMFLGILRGEDLFTMLLAGISLAVAAIPEGLPAVVTVALALGVKRMIKKNALVRQLPAVETLGCTTVICSDKTGTLTQNQMTVCRVMAGDQTFTVSGNGYEPEGKIRFGETEVQAASMPALRQLLEIAAMCNHAQLTRQKKEWKIQGDATEAALLVLAAKAGQKRDGECLKEYPFDSERKCMSVLIRREGKTVLLCKGALDVLIPKCTRYQLENGDAEALTPEKAETVMTVQQAWGKDALRVLGFAFKELPENTDAVSEEAEVMEKDLVFCGICGMMDPPREESAEAIRECREAGIVPVMITGDHPTTAEAIAKKLGMAEETARAVSGAEIDRMTDEKLVQAALENRIFARVEPKHKHRIVRVLQETGQVVAMTGDGVNDAPALKAADIGVAMGKGGTQVAREAASMVLLDDHFRTILEAVRVGRGIYENIRGFIRYLLGSNVGEVLLMLLASICGMPLPVLPIQILWVNLVTDGLPALALGLEEPAQDILKRPPRPQQEGIFAHGLGKAVLLRGFWIALVSLLFFVVGAVSTRMQGGHDFALARTLSFTALVFSQLFYVFSCRSETAGPFELGFLRNRTLTAAVLLSAGMQAAVVHLPVMQTVFQTVPLSGGYWLAILLLTGGGMLKDGIRYLFHRKRKKDGAEPCAAA